MQYIALEGIDNCGKSTIVKHLKKDFPNFNYVREPGTTKYAEELRQVMFSNINTNQIAIQVAMTSARIDLCTQLLKDNKDIISDRCFLSLAYADEFDNEMCEKLLLMNKTFVPLFPKTIIYLQVSAEESVKRFKNKKMEGYDTFDLEAIRRRIGRYEFLLNKVSELSISNVVRINAERKFSLVYDEIRSIIYEHGGKAINFSENIEEKS